MVQGGVPVFLGVDHPHHHVDFGEQGFDPQPVVDHDTVGVREVDETQPGPARDHHPVVDTRIRQIAGHLPGAGLGHQCQWLGGGGAGAASHREFVTGDRVEEAGFPGTGAPGERHQEDVVGAPKAGFDPVPRLGYRLEIRLIDDADAVGERLVEDREEVRDRVMHWRMPRGQPPRRARPAPRPRPAAP